MSVQFETELDAEKTTPERLMTTNEVKIVEHPNWDEWNAVFGNSTHEGAPAFMRAGEIVTDPEPRCRVGVYEPIACDGENQTHACTFCMIASTGSGCPTTPTTRDYTVGVGGNPDFCGCDTADRCSASGVASDNNTLLVWASGCVQVTGSNYNTLAMGRYNVLNRTCHKKLAYEHTESGHFLYWNLQYNAWAIGPELCGEWVTLFVMDGSTIPMAIGTNWTEWTGLTWAESADISVTHCEDGEINTSHQHAIQLNLNTYAIMAQVHARGPW